MGKPLSPEDMRLYRRADEVLQYLWDPIGVAGIPAARDEYDSYVPTVFSLLKKGADKQEIATYLDSAAREDMGLNPPNSLKIAEILVEHRAWISEHPNEPA